EVAAGRTSETGIDLVAERAMTERVDRQIKLLTLAEKRGQLVDAAQLEQAYGQMAGALQTELLALPDKLVQELRTLNGVEDDDEWLNEHIYGCLEQLSRYEPDGPRGDSSDRASPTSDRADRDDGMGTQASTHEREGDGVTWAV
ncbi:hypothetical protein, partial [Klebsiella pneumoniae]|uniref:hypothetical protein n=1 Tax=Klebsiella pneumoniae TaxID=573 RepID=UPI0025A0624F